MLDKILTALRNNDELVLQAPPGAGKTTVVPLALLEETWLGDQQIIVLQPRRIAARAAAERMAELLDEQSGHRVGYLTRQESRVSQHTKILVMTEGVLLRKIQDDPTLEGIGLIIFDEFHERSVDSDLGLMLSAHGRDIIRDTPLKLLVMSATLQGIDIHTYLNNAERIVCQGRSYPVSIEYRPRTNAYSGMIEHTADVICAHLKKHARNTLVFLPGRADIARLAAQLNERLPPAFVVMPLHGSLSKSAQNLAVAPLQNNGGEKFKIILATDIAETSLTIDGISMVVDSGLAKVPKYDPNTGIIRLKTQRVSKASCVQRAGRAGRVQKGVCIRLWSESEQASLQENYSAQILEADLTPVLLMIYAWGVDDINNLRWISAPPQGNVSQAQELLLSLNAIEKRHNHQFHITQHGRALAALPTHPRLAHMIIEANTHGLSKYACIAAALLSEGEPKSTMSVDFAMRVDMVLGDYHCPSTHKSWIRRVKQHYEKLYQIIRKPTSIGAHEYSLGLLLCFAYPDRIAKRLDESTRYKLSNGRVALLDEGDPLRNASWLVVVDAGSETGKRHDKIYSAVALDPSLFTKELKHLTRISEEVYWDSRADRVIGQRSVCVGGLTLANMPLENHGTEKTINALLGYLQKDGFDRLNWTGATKQWQARLALVSKLDTENAWPDISEERLRSTIQDWLAPYLNNVTSGSDIKALDLESILSNVISWPQAALLDELAPTEIVVPSGSKVQVDYTQTPPVLSVKLQEMFGCMQTPKILRGQLALTLHLLSPARRPLQITQDLAGFWDNSYQDIKKEMKGRYPKHPWPDNPREARPTRHTKNRK